MCISSHSRNNQCCSQPSTPKGDTITAFDINFNLSEPTITQELYLDNQEEEKRKISEALRRTNWNKTQAARLLNISRPNLDNKIKQYGLKQNRM